MTAFQPPSARAEEIIENLQIREPAEIQVMEIAMERGAFVREMHLDGSEARLIRKGGLGIISVNSSIPEEGRKRFAIAHELGHFELHAVSQLILCTEEDMYVWNENKAQEIEANEFAASILMPKDIFTHYSKRGQPNMEVVKDLAKAPAYAWLAGEIDGEAEIFEHSLALRSYGVILSLLWIHEDVRPAYRRYDDAEPEFDLTNPFTPDGKRWRW